MQHILVPLSQEIIKKLKAGDELSLSGVLYTARDQAHRRLVGLLKQKKRLPLDLKNAAIYYCGPNPKSGKLPIGSCGPTTSSRMDALATPLLNAGLKVMIGKGRRSPQVKNMIRNKKAVYLLAPAGCGALLAKKVKSAKIIAFKDLKSEAIYRLEVKDFPVIVGVDTRGRDIYRDERRLKDTD